MYSNGAGNVKNDRAAINRNFKRDAKSLARTESHPSLSWVLSAFITIAITDAVTRNLSTGTVSGSVIEVIALVRPFIM